MSDFPNRRIDGLLDRYLRSARDAGLAFDGDARFHAEMQMARRWLASMDDAMAAEGVGGEARERVLRTVIYGVPDPMEAMQRMAEHQRLTELVVRQSVTPEVRRLIMDGQ